MDIRRKYIEWRLNRAKVKIYNNLEMISFHLPKTGGVTFRNLLENHYGRSLKLLYSKEYQSRINNRLPIWLPKLSRAIHGHFQPHKGLDEQFPNAKWVIWLRAPKKRIISHYNYWKENELSGRAYQYFKEHIHSFQDFVMDERMKGQVCMYQTYFKKVNIERFDFVGNLDDFENDIHRFGEQFHIDIPEIPRENKSSMIEGEDYSFTPEMEMAIESEEHLYHQLIKA